MNALTPAIPAAELASLIAEQEADALDDGFPYEKLGDREDWFHGNSGWITPTPFMHIALKELLRALVGIYGYDGHQLLRDIGRDNLRSMKFIEGLGLDRFYQLQGMALAAFPEGEAQRLGFVE